mmetsp:Transcript_44464/g.96708  ORF Transcript_44464/g.96708 Transcript_44464/m.96708 type:complete len:838 (-) Transcript_44464:77-2590(-)|eukprot:CAMPEP_0170605452 /NCGR_PEP_ID=MMETSP0224-20130122/19981_1 /TAXON_ID=285029 /ORGANISM="Togula jolla, Strain CCCM 725" /LENGTH=837 /DNA_ID=CAMNT_0010930457 /DNA_START=69 /DNA_END=2582 /DNA_ORIENTATION=-
MGQSKKKLKRKVKSEKRMSPKAKKKAFKAKQINDANKHRKLKRKASEALAPAKSEEDKLDGIKSVDELLQSNIFDEDEGAESGSDAGDAASEASSAGAFHDVDGGDDDDDAGISALDLDAVGAGAAHEKELLAIKKADPAFYQFLIENDRQLLDFKAPDAEEEEEGEAEEEKTDGAKAAKAQEPTARVLTSERLKTLQDAAQESFTAFKAVLNAFHTAVRSIETGEVKSSHGEVDDKQGDDGDSSDEDAAGGKKKGKKKKRRKAKGVIQIEDETTFSAIIEWTIANAIGLLQKYAGELGDGSKKKKKDKGAWKKQKGGGGPGIGGVLDPSHFTKWPRVKILASIFFSETFLLLNRVSDNEMIEFILRSISSKEALVWLWPFQQVCKKFVRRCCSLWSTSTTHSVRLLAFLFLRNASVMGTLVPRVNGKRAVTELDATMRMMLKYFADAANGGYSWRSISTFRFMENCFIELLRLDDKTAYRIGYACVRQLALILRNSWAATSHGASTLAPKTKDIKGKRKALRLQQAQNLVSWPFMRSVYMWTKATGELPCLKPLAYPLSMIVTGAMKSKLTTLQLFPFTYHCFRCLNRLSASLELFVPVSSHLLKVFGLILPAIDKAYSKKKGSTVRAPDSEVLLRFSEGLANEVVTLEAAAVDVCFLFMEHLGLLARSPAFPEISAPVLFHLRKHSKHCRSEMVRRHLKQVIAATEATSQDVTARREALTQAPPFKRLFLFEADTAMAKARADAISRREADERMRVDAEMEARTQTRLTTEEVEPKPMSRKARKLEKIRKAKERDEAGEAEEAGTSIADVKFEGKAKVDVVEEMGFSSGDEAAAE